MEEALRVGIEMRGCQQKFFETPYENRDARKIWLQVSRTKEREFDRLAKLALSPQESLDL